MMDWVKKLFYACLLILVAMILLVWAVSLLKLLLPWIIGIGIVIGVVYILFWLARRRHDQW